MATYLVKTKIQKYVQGKGKKVSGEVYEKIEKKVLAILDEAVERAEQNDRRTLLPRDI